MDTRPPASDRKAYSRWRRANMTPEEREIERAQARQWKRNNPNRVKESRAKYWQEVEKPLKPHPVPKPKTFRQIALEAGDMFYEGTPCRKCGGTRRYTKAQCCYACCVIQAKTWQKASGNKAQKTWQKRNKKKIAETVKRRKEVNPEPYLLIKRRSESKRRALKLGATISDLPKEQIAMMIRTARTCPDCNRPFTGHRRKELDHVVALNVGGVHHITNMRVICRPCNASKNDRPFASSGQGLLI